MNRLLLPASEDMNLDFAFQFCFFVLISIQQLHPTMLSSTFQQPAIKLDNYKRFSHQTILKQQAFYAHICNVCDEEREYVPRPKF